MRYLLLHGFTGSPESFAGLRVPKGSVSPLLGGHLGSPVLGGFWNEVERLATLAQDCQGLFGYSLGGRFALGMLARHPTRFAHAVIVSASPGLQTDAERDARRDGDRRFIALLRERGIAAFVAAWEKLPLWSTQGALSDSVRTAQRQQRLRHDPEGLAQSLLHHGLAEMPDLRPQLSALSPSTPRPLDPSTPLRLDLLVGERDEKFVKLGRELAALLPQARLTVAPGAGHNLLLERPELCSELFAQGTPS